MTTRIFKFIASGLLASVVPLPADVLELKDGVVLNGKYAGGSPTEINFETSAGMQVIDPARASTLAFTGRSSAAPAVAPAPAASVASVTLPAQTVLLVRLLDPVSSKNAPGANFTTKLEYDLVVNGVVAVKGGTKIYGRVASSSQAGRAIGRSKLDLRLSQIVAGGAPVPIMTSGYQQAGQASIAKAAKGAAAGAAIGAIAGDAGKGAAIGATAGALIRGQTLTIPPGTLLEFTLQQPVTIQAH